MAKSILFELNSREVNYYYQMNYSKIDLINVFFVLSILYLINILDNFLQSKIIEDSLHNNSLKGRFIDPGRQSNSA